MPAGTYTVTVTDVNTCSVTRSITLTEPATLTLDSITSPDYNGYNLHCYNSSDGSIAITVSGGTPPYQFEWNNGLFDEDPTDLDAGNYAVRITDANDVTIEGSITLTAPPQLMVALSTFVYPNGYNISLFGDYNGSITDSVTGGVLSYSFLWSDGATIQNRTNIGFGNYSVEVTDANGCAVAADIMLTQPAREGWALGGNAGIDTTAQFIGTTDNVSISFRTNNLERMKITADGNLKIKNLEDTIQGLDLLFVDAHGVIQKGQKVCTTSGLLPWTLGGNNIVTNPPVSGTDQRIGTCNAHNFVMVTNGVERARINFDGKVGIGISNPVEKLEIAHNNSSGYTGGMSLTNLSTTNKNSEIKFKQYDGTPLWAIGCSGKHNNTHNFFIYDNVANPPYGTTRFFIDADGRTGINCIPPTTSSLYKLFVEGGIVTRDVKVTANSPFPDYVFKKNYKLITIYELEKYLLKYHHLPEIPTAKEVEKNDGFEVGDLQTKLLKKIEEQSLYIISLQKQVDVLNARLDKLSNR